MAKRPPTTLEQMKCNAKRVFVSERMAERAAGDVNKKRGLSLVTYRCPHCKAWHLTKNERRPKITFRTAVL